ncbi:UNVERIFIED_CONTAM: hypothetical protein Slati_3976000 [Sesamum latifolium]|uniref:Reverse transcriptase domain-containing protein n=1 Tax=Sesamum latifolium TaxID=2727402 RepID=A0AAW2TSL8_9LAMI
MVKERPAIGEVEKVQVVEEGRSWKSDLMKYFKEGTFPNDPIQAKQIKFKATRFTLVEDELYKRTMDGPLLKCLDEENAKYVRREIHEGSCGYHSGGRSLAQKSGIDIVGPFPPAVAQKKFIIVAVEYFTKWSQGKAIIAWCKELKIQQNFHNSRKPSVGWADRGDQSHDTPALKDEARSSQRPIVYGTEAIIPTEICEETQRISQYDAAKNKSDRAFDLTVIEEKRDSAYAKIFHHKGLMMRSYNQKVKSRCFQVGDLVLKKVEVSKHVGKLDPRWEGSFKVIEIRKPGTYRLQDMEGKELLRP